ncbi:MAG: VOC family protein [Fimbriimonadaceae bacterium]|nr:VOC family protein [Fimbriimonadaceae bacterium]
MLPILRIARPVTDLALSQRMYCEGLGLSVLGSFQDHDGFDGVMVGREGSPYHFEFTYCRTTPVEPTPTHEDLVVFYIPTDHEWQAVCDSMLAAGFKAVTSYNPYWEKNSRTFEDHDGYRTVLHNGV